MEERAHIDVSDVHICEGSKGRVHACICEVSGERVKGKGARIRSFKIKIKNKQFLTYSLLYKEVLLIFCVYAAFARTAEFLSAPRLPAFNNTDYMHALL